MTNGRIATSVILILALGFFSAAFTQYQAQGTKGGFGFGVFAGMTDMEKKMADYQTGFQGRLFIRHGLFGTGLLQSECGIASGVLKGIDYKTHLLPVDLRLLFSPFRFAKCNLYFYGGAGALWYEDKLATAHEEWTGVIPAGLGLQFQVGELTALEISGGYNYVFRDKLDMLDQGSHDDGYVNVTAGLTIGGENPNADADNDGLTNKLEKEIGTNKKIADTDNDGLSDGEEYNQYKTNPFTADSDQDQLSDGDEVKQYRTNPLKADSDGDGLNDFVEIMTHKTNALKADSDGDGLDDNDEIAKYKTNALKADSDDDELSDGDEVLKHKTDPFKKDSDADGLTDGKEVKQYKTDPLKADSDGDGLSDLDEVQKYSTNPTKMDTDGGTIADGPEVARGTNPLDMEDDLPKEEKIKGAVGTQIVMEGITFDSGSAIIRQTSFETLDKVAKTLSENPEIEVEVQGHTDNTGSREGNIALSKARAEAVCSYLVTHGIAQTRLKATGMGPDQPIAPNDTREGRQQNRRITFVRIK